MPNTTDLRRVAKMEDFSTEALRCHAWGHPWLSPPAVPFKWWDRTPALLLRFECPSCGAVRRDVRDQRNPRELITRLYLYDHDYLAGFPCDRGDFVEEWFRRFELPPDDIADDLRIAWTGGGLQYAEAS